MHKILYSTVFQFSAKFKYVNFFAFFYFTLWSVGRAKFTRRRVLLFFVAVDQLIFLYSGWDKVICLYHQMPDNVKGHILWDWFWFVYIPFGCMVKFRSLSQSLFHSLHFFTPTLAGGFSLESEWQQTFPGLQDSSQYCGWC